MDGQTDGIAMAYMRYGMYAVARKNSTFFKPHWSSSVEFQITGYNDQGRLRHTGSQDIVLSCHV